MKLWSRMHLLLRCDNSVCSASRFDMRLHELPHHRRDLVIHVRQATLLLRAVIIDRAPRGPLIGIQNVPLPSDMPMLGV